MDSLLARVAKTFLSTSRRSKATASRPSAKGKRWSSKLSMARRASRQRTSRRPESSALVARARPLHAAPQGAGFLCLSPEFVRTEDQVFVFGRINQRFNDHRSGSLESLGQGVMYLCDRTHSGHRHAKVMAWWGIGGRPERRAIARKALVFLFQGSEF